MFKEESLATVLKRVSEVIDEKQLCEQKFIQSGLLQNLCSLLCNPSEIGETTFVIKSFLSVFLNFKTESENHYSWDRGLFESFVRLVLETYDYVVSVLKRKRRAHIESSPSILESFRKDEVVILNLLQSLYILNSSWHQWFDIAEENKIINESLFESFLLNCYLLDELEVKSEKLSSFFDVAKLCPVTVNKKFRLEMLNRLLPKQRGRVYFPIQRHNVLEDIIETFKSKQNFVEEVWGFLFKGEMGQGPGVTNEAYSILSQELQRHDINLWQTKPAQRPDEGTKYIQSPNGLLPKISDNAVEFEIFGQILAKAFLDRHFLDISLNNEIFQRLGTNQYSHLRRDYFDLLRAFPMLESLFKQLLPIKRKIEVIKSEVGLSERQKHEIISNLTFDDGNSFDDLCLNFTVPGTDVELMEGGHEVILAPHNIDLYLEKLCARKVQMDPLCQFEAIRSGFDQVLSLERVEIFLPEELRQLICCDQFKRWTTNELRKYCVYNENSQSVQFLFQCLASFDIENQKMFLKFVTGKNGLPVGGLSNLRPPLTISRTIRDHPDSSLPTSSTCSSHLFLPDYSSLNVTRQQLLYAISEGNGSFEYM